MPRLVTATESSALSRANRSTDGECGWPADPREREDFYHRVRAFPPDVAEWRQWMVDHVAAHPRLFAAVRKTLTRRDILPRIDEGISYLREVARLLALIYSPVITSSQGNSHEPSALEPDAAMVLARLGPYRELGLDLARLDRKRLQTVLSLIIPPNLSFSLGTTLVAHARSVCRPVRPRCEDCELRNFCVAYRGRAARRSQPGDSPTVVDLFAGAGGLSEGFGRTGFRVVLALDSDPVALRTYWLNHPELPDDGLVLKDIRELKRGELRHLTGRRQVDVLVGAPPCQGFSRAGFRCKPTRTGYSIHSDERNYLFEQMVAAASELRPKLFLMENVPGMHSARREDRSFLEIARRMLEKATGFNADIWRLNAAAYGVPQDRIRYFLVASGTGVLPLRPAEEYQDIQRADFEIDALPPIALDEAIFDLPPLGAGVGSGVGLWEPNPSSGDRRYRRYLDRFGMRRRSRLIYNHTVRYHNDRDLELYSLLRPGEDSVHAIERYRREDLMRYRRDVFDDKYCRLRGDRPSKTIVAHLAKDGNGYIHPTQVRSISLREGARIQSFHDGYVFCGSRSDQWVQLGNAVPPVLAEAIAKSFRAVLQKVAAR